MAYLTNSIQEHLWTHLIGLMILDILGACITNVKAGYNCQKLLTLSDATIRNYFNLAAALLHIMTRCPCGLAALLATTATPFPTLPYLRKLIGQRRNWKQQKPRQEPYSLPMFSALKKALHW
jgi:hypothetical protein